MPKLQQRSAARQKISGILCKNLPQRVLKPPTLEKENRQWFSFSIFYLLFLILCFASFLHHHQISQCQHNADRKGDPCRLDKACNDVGNKGNGSHADCVRQLCGYMVYVVALGSGRCHDRCIGDRGAMVTADSSCHAGGDSNGHQCRVGCLECVYNDRDQDSESSPGSSGCKCQQASNYKDDSRKQIYNT